MEGRERHTHTHTGWKHNVRNCPKKRVSENNLKKKKENRNCDEMRREKLREINEQLTEKLRKNVRRNITRSRKLISMTERQARDDGKENEELCQFIYDCI